VGAFNFPREVCGTYAGAHMNESKAEKKTTIEVPDILLFLGLALLFAGLGFAVSWPWAMAITGAVLIGLAIWLVEPRPIDKVSPNA